MKTYQKSTGNKSIKSYKNFNLQYQTSLCFKLGVTIAAQEAMAKAQMVQVFTIGAQSPCKKNSASQAGVWGMARVVRAEAQLQIRCVDVQATSSFTNDLSDSEPEVVSRSATLWIPRLAQHSAVPSPSRRRRGSRSSGRRSRGRPRGPTPS